MTVLLVDTLQETRRARTAAASPKAATMPTDGNLHHHNGIQGKINTDIRDFTPERA
ncbi:hypothetical protein [Megalodesulfovibrio gigas]|uniref:hypothetical protein n=1 Tax=Megalodesulfovibrio gigas TaxID=879 RepID=UPI0012B56432|nr:hypothetical protein [Megalodesulfovibrio gigas]